MMPNKGYSLSYQGALSHGNKATSKGVNAFTAKEQIEKFAEKNPKSVEGNEAALSVIRNTTSPDDLITIYRATPGNSINQGDWVFLQEDSAVRWAVSTFSADPYGDYKAGNTKLGLNGRNFQVIAAQVKASEVDWTGKNLEFMYTSKKRLK